MVWGRLRWLIGVLLTIGGMACLSLAAFLLNRWSVGFAVTGVLLLVLEYLSKPEARADA
jgi:hypothetical protein